MEHTSTKSPTHTFIWKRLPKQSLSIDKKKKKHCFKRVGVNFKYELSMDINHIKLSSETPQPHILYTPMTKNLQCKKGRCFELTNFQTTQDESMQENS